MTRINKHIAVAFFAAALLLGANMHGASAAVSEGSSTTLLAANDSGFPHPGQRPPHDMRGPGDHRPDFGGDRGDHFGRPDRPGKGDRGDHFGRPDRPDRGDRGDHFGRPDRPGKGDRGDHFGRPDRPDRGDRGDHFGRPDRPDRGDRGDHFGRPDRPGKGDRGDHFGRPDRPDRGDRGNHFGRPDRPGQGASFGAPGHRGFGDMRHAFQWHTPHGGRH